MNLNKIKSTRFQKITCWLKYGHSPKPTCRDVWTCEYCGKTLYNNK